MDTAYAVRSYVIVSFAAVFFTVFAQLNWIISFLVFSSMPFYYWYSLALKIDDGLATEMYYLQLQVSFLFGVIAYKI